MHAHAWGAATATGTLVAAMPPGPDRDELLGLIRMGREFERQRAVLERGRAKGAAVQRLAAALRQSAIERAVGDLMRNPETARWRTDVIVDFLFQRQTELGMRTPYSRNSLDRRVRAAIRKYRTANNS